MYLLFLSSAPVIIILFFIYLRDKYEKEPIKLLVKILIFGAISVIPVFIIEKILMYFGQQFLDTNSVIFVFFNSFIVAGLTEEAFKFLVIYIFIWNNKEFNEIFDGIVYATYASLGFALIENILYVYSKGASVGIVRAFTAVPAHMIFGITMGFFFGLAKFGNKKHNNNLVLAVFVPIVLHGFYDFILMLQNNFLLFFFLIYLIGILILSIKMIKKHSNNSKFNPKNNSLSG